MKTKMIFLVIIVKVTLLAQDVGINNQVDHENDRIMQYGEENNNIYHNSHFLEPTEINQLEKDKSDDILEGILIHKPIRLEHFEEPKTDAKNSEALTETIIQPMPEQPKIILVPNKNNIAQQNEDMYNSRELQYQPPQILLRKQRKHKKPKRRGRKTHRMLSSESDESTSSFTTEEDSHEYHRHRHRLFKRIKPSIEIDDMCSDSNVELAKQIPRIEPSEIDVKLSKDAYREKPSLDYHDTDDYKELLKNDDRYSDFEFDSLKLRNDYENLDNLHYTKIDSADTTRHSYIENRIKETSNTRKRLEKIERKLRRLLDMIDKKYTKVSSVVSDLRNTQSQTSGEIDNRKKNEEEMKRVKRELEAKTRLTENEIYNLTKKIKREKEGLERYHDQISMIMKHINESKSVVNIKSRSFKLNDEKIKEYERLRKVLESDKCAVEDKIEEITKKIEEAERKVNKLEIQGTGVDDNRHIPLYAKY